MSVVFARLALIVGSHSGEGAESTCFVAPGMSDTACDEPKGEVVDRAVPIRETGTGGWTISGEEQVTALIAIPRED